MKRLHQRFSLRRMLSRKDGWTLAELLIVVVIIAILAVIFLMVNWKRNVFRAQDARRKADLNNIRRAFEEYYNDNGCYPSLTILESCGSTDLAPYIKTVPCDPTTKDPYKYEPDSVSNLCSGNRVCAKLQDWADPDITSLGCHPEEGCGWGAFWNYCLATGTTVIAPGFVPGGTVTPTPTPSPILAEPFACRNPGVCNDVGDPDARGCPAKWSDPNCQGMCPGNPGLWCP